MTSLPELLQPLRLPLRGSRLIEASAGTGKTFTIAALYLRLVLGHGGDAAFARPLTPPEILVVTFTEAATQELRDRIRARLAEAADAFLADPADMAQAGNLLHDLRADYPPAQWPACARTLRLAAEWMDEAAVSTIHGWCNRMLREHAFDSGSPFTQTLQTDQSELQAEVVCDYWRSFCTPLAPDDAAQVRAWWATPEQLQGDVGKLLEQTDALGAGEAPATALKTARDVAARELAALKGPWAGETGWAAELLRRLEGAVAAKHCKLPKRKDWMQALRDWAEAMDKMFAAYQQVIAAWPHALPDALLDYLPAGQDEPLRLVDWLGGLRADDAGARCRVLLESTGLVKDKRYRRDKLVPFWVAHVAGHLGGEALTTVVVSKAGTVTLAPMVVEEARGYWGVLLQAWQRGLCQPLPLALRTGFVWLEAQGTEGDTPQSPAWQKARVCYEGDDAARGVAEGGQSAYLARAFPSFEALWAQGAFAQWARTLLAPLDEAVQKMPRAAA